jgi:hypothetical protein
VLPSHVQAELFRLYLLKVKGRIPHHLFQKGMGETPFQ